MGATERYSPPCRTSRERREARRRVPLRGTRSRGFTLPELLAVLAIVVLLIATFVPYAMSLRETANRQKCALSLYSIREALNVYARDFGTNYSYPRTRFDPRLGNRWTAFTGADDPSPFAPGSAVQPNDVSAALWLLVRTTGARPEWFVCPSSAGVADRLLDAGGRPTSPASRGNFRGPENLTYAFATPYSAIEDYVLNDRLPADFILLADQGPSVQTLRSSDMPSASAEPRRMAIANSRSHRGAGQNVLHAAGYVTFESSPYCGVGVSRDDPKRPGDNIYTALAAKPIVAGFVAHDSVGTAGTDVGPAYRYDSYLVPGEAFVAPLPFVAPQPATSRAATAPAATSRSTVASTTRATPATTRAAATPARTTPATAASTRPASRPATTPAASRPASQPASRP